MHRRRELKRWFIATAWPSNTAEAALMNVSLVVHSQDGIGEDIKTAQFGWPVEMPLIRKLGAGLWEVRSHVSNGIVREIFTVDGQTPSAWVSEEISPNAPSGSDDGEE